MSSNTDSIYDNIFNNLKGYELLNNPLLQIALRQSYISGTYDFQEIDDIKSGKFLSNFIATYGLPEAELINSYQLQTINIYNFLAKICDNMKIKETDYEILINRKTETLVEIMFIEDGKLFIVEFLHSENKFIEKIFIIKNELFDNDKYDLFFKKVITENFIDFTI
jgi:hypothetical protein